MVIPGLGNIRRWLFWATVMLHCGNTRLGEYQEVAILGHSNKLHCGNSRLGEYQVVILGHSNTTLW